MPRPPESQNYALRFVTAISGCFADELARDAALPAPLRTAADALSAATRVAVVSQPARTSGLGFALPPLVPLADGAAAPATLEPGWLGAGAVWREASRWDEVILACRGARGQTHSPDAFEETR